MPPHICIISSVHLALDNRVFYREARSLSKAGYKVTLIAIHPREETRDGIHIVGLPPVPRWQRPRLWLKLLHLARRQNADLYHFHDPELLLVTPWLRLRTGKPTIYDIHEVYADFIKVKDYIPAGVRYPLAWIFRPLEPLLARLQSALIFSDDEIAKAFARLNKPKTTLFNFPAREFVETGILRTADDMPRHPWVLHLGGHERNRGAHLMVDALARIRQSRPDARLLLVGHFMPPALEDEVRAHAADLGIAEAVTITGRVPFETIGDYLSQAAVGWVPWQAYPKNEKNIPTKLFEYMSYALPVVASDLDSTRPFVLDGENGYRVPPADPDAHAEAILRLLNAPAEASRMGRRGQTFASERWNWDKEEKKLLRLYAKLVGPPPSEP